MKTSYLGGLILAAGLLSVPAFGHHSFAAEYDGSKTLKVTGTVTSVEWLNPHVRFNLDVKEESGNTSAWEFELGSPNTLMRKGWSRHSLKPGDMVTVVASPAKDGSKLGSAKTVKLADGRELFGGSNEKEDSKTAQ